MREFRIIIVTIASLISLFCVACQNNTSQKKQNIKIDVQNLETFARLYGYVRWFHPSDEAQIIDWEKFAILGVQKVENIKSVRELRDTLYNLFSPIVPGLQIYETQKPEVFDLETLHSPDPKAKPVAWQHYGVYLKGEPNIYKSIRANKSETNKVMFNRMPQFGEIIKEPIGSDLTCVVPLTLLTNNTSTYPQTDRSKLALLQSELENISFKAYGFEPQVNMASIIITWNVLQHFFPYFDVIDTDWNKVLGETINSTLANKQRIDFFGTLSQMIALLDDGHGSVYFEPMNFLPIKAELIDKKIIITASDDSTLKIGDIILKIDGKSSSEEFEERKKVVSGSPQLRKYRALNILGSKLSAENTFVAKLNTNMFANDSKETNSRPSDETQLLIERDEKEQTIVVANKGQGSLLFNPIDKRKYSSETILEIEPGIYYVNMAKCTINEFEQKKHILAKAKAVIYDQRINNRLYLSNIIPYLINKPVASTWWNIPQTVYPDRKGVEFTKFNWVILPKQPFFTSKSIVINTSALMSAAETMIDIIDHYNLATMVGESTGGCNGNYNCINLPCGYKVKWTGMKVLKHDGSQLYQRGFEPNYPVNKTLQAVKEGRDEYLEKALEIARQSSLANEEDISK